MKTRYTESAMTKRIIEEALNLERWEREGVPILPTRSVPDGMWGVWCAYRQAWHTHAARVEDAVPYCDGCSP